LIGLLLWIIISRRLVCGRFFALQLISRLFGVLTELFGVVCCLFVGALLIALALDILGDTSGDIFIDASLFECFLHLISALALRKIAGFVITQALLLQHLLRLGCRLLSALSVLLGDLFEILRQMRHLLRKSAALLGGHSAELILESVERLCGT